MCGSTCFGRLHAHHQELTTALTTSGFTLERGGSSVVGQGLARPRPTTLLPPKSYRENQNKHFMFNNVFSKIVPLWDNVDCCRAGRTTNDNMVHASCMLDTWGYKHTLRICNTYCVSTATVVARKRLNVTLYVHIACLVMFLNHASRKSRRNKLDYYRLLSMATLVTPVTKVLMNVRRFSCEVPRYFFPILTQIEFPG